MIQKKKFFIFSIIFILAAISVYYTVVFAADHVVREKFYADAENLSVSDINPLTAEDLFATNLSDDSQVYVTNQDVISGEKSFLLQNCDIRWENLGLEDHLIGIEFKLKAEVDFSGVFDLYCTTKGVNGGEQKFVTVRRDGSALGLYDNVGNLIFDMVDNTVYKISISIENGSSQYRIVINDANSEIVGDLPGAVYILDSVSMRLNTSGSTSDLLVDDIRIYSEGKSYPQKYSAQEPGAIPDIVLPSAAPEATNISLYVNGTKINFSDKLVARDGTVYVPCERFFDSVGLSFSWDKDTKTVTAKNEKLDMIFSVDSNIVTINTNNIVLTYAPTVINDVLMIPLNMINEAINAKVWWDEESDTVAVTTGSAKNDSILRNINGKLYMNGEPYYEISFLYEDLANIVCNAFYENPDNPYAVSALQEADRVLAAMHALGFQSVRTYLWDDIQFEILHSATKREAYFNGISLLMDLCDRYEIRLIPCLGLNSKMFLNAKYVDGYGWVSDTENTVDLVANADSVSRKNMYDFLDEFIKRFRDRNTVLFWELANDGNLDADNGASNAKVTYSLLQLSNFYADCAERIRAIDNTRLIGGGDGLLRTAQWHLFTSTMNGETEDWTYDTSTERLKALTLLTQNLDMMSIHGYDVGITTNAESYYSDTDGSKIQLTFPYMVSESKLLGKLLYNGATNGVINYTTVDGSNTDLLAGQIKYLDSIIEGGVQLSYWRLNNGAVMSTSFFEQNELSSAVANANQRLSQRYVINKAFSENTNQAWSDSSFEVIDTAAIKPGEVVSNVWAFLYDIGKIFIAVVVGFVLILFIIMSMHRKELAHRRAH